MKKIWKALVGAACLAAMIGVATSGERPQLRLMNNTNKSAKVEITRGKDASCQDNGVYDTVVIPAGGERLIPFDDHAYVCFRVDNPTGGEATWRSKTCAPEKPDCSAVIAQ